MKFINFIKNEDTIIQLKHSNKNMNSLDHSITLKFVNKKYLSEILKRICKKYY